MPFDKEPDSLSPTEIWLAAAELVAVHSGDAPKIAARRARVCLEIGAVAERRTWLHVLAATKALVELLPPAEDGPDTVAPQMEVAMRVTETVEKGV